jgi:hypothetical protein
MNSKTPNPTPHQAHEIPHDFSCPICLDEGGGEEAGEAQSIPVSRLPCGHILHDVCIQEWLARHNDCPMCKVETLQPPNPQPPNPPNPLHLQTLNLQTLNLPSPPPPSPPPPNPQPSTLDHGSQATVRPLHDVPEAYRPADNNNNNNNSSAASGSVAATFSPSLASAASNQPPEGGGGGGGGEGGGPLGDLPQQQRIPRVGNSGISQPGPHNNMASAQLSATSIAVTGGYSADNRRVDPHNLAVHVGGASAGEARGEGGPRRVLVDQFGVPPLSWRDETTGGRVHADTVFASRNPSHAAAYSIGRGPATAGDGNGAAGQRAVGGGAQSLSPSSLGPVRQQDVPSVSL